MTGNFPIGGPVPPAYGPVFAPPSSKPSRAGVWLGSIACVLAAAALVVGVIALVTVRHQDIAAPLPDSAVASAQVLVDSADKPLCEAIAPLMREASDRTNAFLRTGTPDSPERLDAIAKFKTETLAWASRMQNILDDHAEPPRYLTRTLQRYIDGLLLYSENMYKDRGPDPFDNTTYDSAIVASGGPLGTCYKVGVRWTK